MSGVVCLINLINREIRRIDIGGEFGLEWRTDAAKGVEFNSTEEFVVLDFISTTTAEAVLRVANEAIIQD